MKAEKFARRFAERSWRNEVRVEVRSPHIFVSRLRCLALGDRCEGSVDAVVSPPDPRRRPERMPEVVPEPMLAQVRESVRSAARWCTGRASKWGTRCRHRIAQQHGTCRAAPLASGSWLSWLCDLGASVMFGGWKHRDAAYAAVKSADVRSVRDGVAVLAVCLRWEPADAARPVLRALCYEARRWGLRVCILPRNKVDQSLDAVTSLFMRQEGRAWRRKVKSGQWRVVQDPYFDMLVRVDGAAS